MTGMRLQRFDRQHLQDFRGPITVRHATEEPVVEIEAPPPAPTFSESDIEHARAAAKKIGYAEGFEAGLLQATSEATAREKEIALAMAQIHDQLDRMGKRHQLLINQQSTELSELVMMIARKVAGDALKENAADTLAAMVERCLPVIFGKPRITIELSPTLFATAQPVLTEKLQQGGFEGDIQFRANEALDAHDMRLDWGHGEASRTTEALWQEIEALLQQSPLTPTLPKPIPPAPLEETTHG